MLLQAISLLVLLQLASATDPATPSDYNPGVVGIAVSESLDVSSRPPVPLVTPTPTSITTPPPATSPTAPPRPTSPTAAPDAATSLPTVASTACGTLGTGPRVCVAGKYCQPWNPSYYQCIDVPSKCPIAEIGVDFHGDDLVSYRGLQPGECCDQCAANPACRAYTFVNYNADNKSWCYLKKGPGERRASPGTVSFRRS